MIPLAGRMFMKAFAPKGIYEYVIARTRYIDDVCRHALENDFDQVLVLGAGFDTRAIRFGSRYASTIFFELDVPVTQNAKKGQYLKRGINLPANLVFISIDFDKESFAEKLEASGFQKNKRSLFILEGLIMYLDTESITSTFGTIRDFSGDESRVVFDYVRASVLHGKGGLYGESGAADTVGKAGEQWRFGIEPAEIDRFTRDFNFSVRDHKCAEDLEIEYFTGLGGSPAIRINGTHCLVTAVRK